MLLDRCKGIDQCVNHVNIFRIDEKIDNDFFLYFSDNNRIEITILPITVITVIKSSHITREKNENELNQNVDRKMTRL